jgi:hypothetical protein
MAKKRSRKRKLKAKLALLLHRVDYGKDRVVYLLTTNKPYRYTYARSRIAYIGTSKNGASRVAQSAVYKGKPFLEVYGINTLSAYVITVPGKQNVKNWKRLESALLLAFRREYGEKPRANKQQPRGKPESIFKDFKERSLVEILRSVG